MTRAPRLAIRLCMSLALMVALASCTLPQPESTAYRVATAYRPPGCAHAGKAVPLPAGFPHNFPLPAKTILTSVFRSPKGPTTTVNGIIGSSDFNATVKFFDDYLPLSGFATARAQTFSTSSIGDTFIGHGYAGKVTLGLVPRSICAGEVIFNAYSVPGSQLPVDTY